jgi:hypothetical protein
MAALMPEPIEFADFCSPAYRLETPNAASSVMRNWCLEVVERGPRTGKMRMRPTPGLRAFSILPDAPVRGLLRIDGGNRLFAVGGSTVYEVFPDGTFQALTGNVANSTRPAIMATNGFQLAIASGGFGYLVSGGTPGTVDPISYSTDGSPVRAASIDFLSQFFVAALLDSKTVTSSRPAPNGGTWDGEAAVKEGYPDNIARVFADNQTLWLYGFDTMEPWVGNPAVGGFPFASQNVVLKFGTSAPYSVAGAQGYRFWLQRDEVYSATGMQPERISDYGVETAIQSYGDTSDAEGFCQPSGGHLYYFLSFPSANRTWVYDVSTKSWHERLYFSGGQYSRFRGRVYANAFKKDLVGDYQTGAIYEMSDSLYTDDGTPVRRQRTCPYITGMNQNLPYATLELDMDTGIGLSVEPDAAGVDPQIILRYSDDRGKTWGNELQEPLGRFGETSTRVIFRQLGSSYLGKVFDLVVTDPCRCPINTAYLRVGR